MLARWLYFRVRMYKCRIHIYIYFLPTQIMHCIRTLFSSGLSMHSRSQQAKNASYETVIQHMTFEHRMGGRWTPVSLSLPKELLAVVTVEEGKNPFSLAFGRLPVIGGWFTPTPIWAAPFGYLVIWKVKRMIWDSVGTVLESGWKAKEGK